MKTNTITVNIQEGKERVMAPALRWEYDLAQYLKIEGLQLPEYYQVDFCNVGDEETITMVGTADGVLIPDQLIQTGLPIAAYLYLQTGTESWNTEIMILISVMGRPERTDIEPTPEEQSTIDSLLAAMNEAVADGVGVPAGGTAGQVLKKASDEDYDAEWADEEGGLFVVELTGSGSYTRTSNKTPAQIKAAYDAGMTVIANITASNTIAYLYQSTASRAEFRTLPLTGMSNDYPSMMWQEFNLAGASTTTVNITYTSVTSAESLVGKVQPHVAFRIEWNDGDYLPEMLTWFDASDWDSFYYGNLGTVVAYLQSVEYVNNEPQNTTFISRKVWETVEYDSEYGDNVNVGNIIFMHTEVDGQTLRTTEIHWKHYIWNDRMEITKRITAECSVTATTDYPQKWDPQ